MKILQLCNKAPYPANDGSSIAICNLAEGLADNGIELHILPINTKKHFKPDNNVPASFIKKTYYQSVYKDTNTSTLGAFTNLFSGQSYFVSRFFFKEYEESLIKKLTGTSFDVVQLEGVFMATYIPTIKKYSKAKITLRAHNIEHQIWERHLPHEKNWFKKTYITLQNNRLKAFELDTFSLVDAIVTITDEDKKGIQQLVPQQKIHTCLTGINLETYKQIHQATQPNTVFHFASMDWLPNIEAVEWLLENVWQVVLKKIPDAQLILAGRGMPEKIKHAASKNITIIENVADSALFYAAYDVMLVPLWSGSGLRIKLVEGLAYGKPIITTSIGAEGIPYTKNKELLIADTAEEFVNAIINLLSNPTQKQQLQINARVLAESHFDYKKLASRLILFYEQLISN
jgi:glycosyltransferase involved in cell wall biosynthesis